MRLSVRLCGCGRVCVHTHTLKEYFGVEILDKNLEFQGVSCLCRLCSSISTGS